jgi:hypothetical protein
VFKKGDLSLQPGQEEKYEILFNTWFSDEAYFNLDGTVNEQKLRFWGMEPPEDFHGKNSHRGKVTIWITISSHGLIGPVLLMKQTLSDICICSRTTACCIFWQMACLSIHSG